MMVKSLLLLFKLLSSATLSARGESPKLSLSHVAPSQCAHLHSVSYVLLLRPGDRLGWTANNILKYKRRVTIVLYTGLARWLTAARPRLA